MPGSLHYIVATPDAKMVYKEDGSTDRSPLNAKKFKTIGSAKKWAERMGLKDWQVFESTYG